MQTYNSSLTGRPPPHGRPSAQRDAPRGNRRRTPAFAKPAWLLVPACAACLAAAGCRFSPRETHLEAAIARFRAGDIAGAATLLELAAERAPQSPAIQANLGIVYWKLGQTDRAAEALRRADRLAAGDERPLEFLARVLIERGDVAGARHALTLAADRAPLSARVLTALAEIEYREGENDRALAALDQALDAHPGYAPALYNLGILYRDRLDQPDRAAERFAAWLEAAPESARRARVRAWLDARTPSAPPDADTGAAAAALLASSRDAIARDALDEAMILLTRAVTAHPGHADTAWELAVLYDRHLGYRLEAAEAYGHFVERFADDPRVAEARRRQGLLEGEASDPSGDDNGAGDAFKRALRFQRAGDWPRAIRAYRNALSQNPRLASAAYNLGLCYRGAGRNTEARKALEQAVGLQPGLREAHYMLAVIARETGRDSDAVQRLERLLEQDADYARAHLLLGLIHRDAGRLQPARTHLRRYAALAPGEPGVRNIRAWLETSSP